MDSEHSSPAMVGDIDAGVRLLALPEIGDARGTLSFAQVPEHLPFTPQRYFLLYNLQANIARGAHAHRRHQQFLVCVHGSARVLVDDARHQREYELASPARGLYVAPMLWVTVLPDSTDTVLLVLTSAAYDAADYVRDYQEFQRLQGD